jgi:RecB family exonuclease
LGTIYHRIFERLYESAEDPTNSEALLSALPTVASSVLDEAPSREGFRVTAWWSQTRAEIVEDVDRSLRALAAHEDGYTPRQHEAVFGMRGAGPLVVRDGDDRFQLRGFIDRVDTREDGALRIIDYKTAGPHAYTKRAVAEGKKLQLPLYALAARDALGLGEPRDGFYWHVRHAQPSPFRLSTCDGGPELAMETAVAHAWEAVRGARAGRFTPRPPAGGCPRWCPASGFCWQASRGYRP